MTQINVHDRAQLKELYDGLQEEYVQAQAKGLKLDLSRGKPAARQFAFSMELLREAGPDDPLLAEDGTDCRNYGCLEGIPEARRLMAEILQVSPGEVLIGGNSSLNLMHDCMGFAYVHGLPRSEKPWGKLEEVKFLCPSPGYDRHFAVSQHFGFTLVPVDMTPRGPDMDQVERLVTDPSVKGMWCIPKYSNPTGITYCAETVRRMANLSPAAPDFCIFWDNAYAVHDFYPGEGDELADLFAELKKAGNEDMALFFTSTSKITFAGGGISAVAASKTNMAWLKKHFSLQTIGYDKLNQLRHARFLPNLAAVQRHMVKHADIMRPKFELVLDILQRDLGGAGIASWSRPRGGYFISLDTCPGCAKRTVELCGQAGVVMTPAGASFPYGVDPQDRNIRIAPSFASLEELQAAVELMCLCVKLATIEELMKQ